VHSGAGWNSTFVAWTARRRRRSFAAMTAGARSPEELDSLIEDAFVLRDRAGLEALFEDRAVVVEVGGSEARGAEAVARMWARGRTYVARTRRVLQTPDTALVIADSALHVLRRDGEGAWRATITLLELRASNRPEDA
jgi:ketosteroid isomerase-like protein